MAEVDRQIEEQVERQKRALLRRLAVVGEKVVNKARSLPSPPRSVYWDSSKGERLRNIPPHQPNYIDWTDNLRSSIGYVVVMDGQVVEQSTFAPVKTGAAGSREGKAYAEGLASRYPVGIVLIVVAGMNYAAYVQRKGYNVTASAELLAEQLLSQLGLKGAAIRHEP